MLENAAYTRIGEIPWTVDVLMLSDGLEFEGSDFHQLRHTSWLTLAYIVSVTASQPIVRNVLQL